VKSVSESFRCRAGSKDWTESPPWTISGRKLSSRMRQFLLQIKLYWIACFGASLGGLIQTA
jgi:hypothetical protein